MLRYRYCIGILLPSQQFISFAWKQFIPYLLSQIHQSTIQHIMHILHPAYSKVTKNAVTTLFLREVVLVCFANLFQRNPAPFLQVEYACLKKLPPTVVKWDKCCLHIPSICAIWTFSRTPVCSAAETVCSLTYSIGRLSFPEDRNWVDITANNASDDVRWSVGVGDVYIINPSYWNWKRYKLR